MRKRVLRNGDERFVRLLSFLPGSVLADVRPHTPELLRSLGRLLGRIDHALQDFSHPATTRALKWDLAQAEWIREYISHIEDSSRRTMVKQVLERYESQVVRQLPKYGKARSTAMRITTTFWLTVRARHHAK
ncbi:MAG TPA: phosphotransferase [Terriglobales bacterium]|nr:phosphotransferase [Terriglobales bacterium]